MIKLKVHILQNGLIPISKLVKNLLNGPGMLIQKLTTKEPDESQLEVAIESMEYAVKLNEN